MAVPSNVQTVFGELLNMGYSPVQAAGAIGRFQQESYRRLDPTAVGDNGAAHGIGQWHSDRWNKLLDFAQSNGLDPDSAVTQAKFFNWELNGPEKAAGAQLRQAMTIPQAAAAMMAYERPAGWSPDDPQAGSGWSNTIANAKNVYARLGSADPAPSVSAPSQSPSASPAPVSGSMAPQDIAQSPRIPDFVKQSAGVTSAPKAGPDGLAALLGSMVPQAPQFSPVSFASPSQAASLSSLVQALKSRMA